MPRFNSVRPLAAFTIFATGIAAGLFFAPSPAITADGDAGAAGAVAALETRVRALEDLLATHISAENLKPPDEGGVVLKAPFNIVDDSNHVIFAVEADGGGIVQVMADGGKRGIRLDGTTNRITAEGDGGKFEAGDTGNGWGLVVSDAGGTPLADLSQPGGKGMALRIYSDGANAAQIGVAPGTGGLLRLFANGDKRTIGLDSNADGTGTIQVAGKKGEDAGITLDGQAEKLTLDTTKGISTLGAADEGWGLHIGDAGGQPMADLSEPQGKGMALRIYSQGSNAAQLGVAPGTGGLLRLFNEGDKRTVGLDSNPDGSGSIVVTGKEGEDVGGIWLDGQKDVVRVKSDKGVAALGGDDQGWGMVVRDAGGNPQAAVNTVGGNPALRVYQSNVEVVVAGSQGGNGTVNVYSKTGKDAAAAISANADGSGYVQAGDGSGKKGIKLDGQKSVVFIDTAKGTAGLGAIDAGWGLAIGDAGGNPLADLARADGKGTAMRVYEGGAQSAALGVIPGQGGQLRLYDNDNLAVSAGAEGDSGRLQVYKSGVPTAVLNGGKSVVAVVNESGTPVSMLTIASSGSGGNVTVSDPSGNGVFSAGYDGGDGPGTACVEHKGTKCLGVGLTGMEGMH